MAVPETIKALSVKPPGDATVHEMPEPSAAPSNAAGDPKAPGSPKMAYMPVPTTTKALSVKPPGEAEVYDTPPATPASSNASGDPKAPGSPKMAYMPVPETTKALSVKPPGEATEHEAPPASVAPSNAAGDPKAPGSPKMAYMPVPETTKALSVKPPGETEVHEMPAPSAAPSNAAGDPKAPGSPKIAYMPVPESTKALSVKPPGEATVHEAPPSIAPLNAAGDPKAPGSPKMAFMPAPAAGSGSALSVSGGHGKKEEKPAGPAQSAQPVTESARAHPAAARMAAPATLPSSGSKLSAGITGAVIGCLIGAAIWYLVALNVGGWRILAWIPGIVGGFGAVLLAKKPSEKLGRAAAVVAAIITILTQMAVIAGINDQRLTEASETSYRERMALAKKAAEAKTDDQVRNLIDEDPDYDGFNAHSLREALKQAIDKAKKAEEEEANKAAGKDPGDADKIAEYRQKRLPELVKFSQGDPSRTRFIEKERARLEEEGEVLYRKKYISMGIWIFSSIEAAFLIGRGKKKQ